MSYGIVDPNALRNVTDTSVMQAMQNPQLPGEGPVAIDEWQRRQKMRTAAPTPPNTNPMGAQQVGTPPIGQPPQQAGLLATSPQQQNPIMMAVGGIVPYDHAVDGPKIRKYLQDEIDRRAKGGQIKKFDLGGIVNALKDRFDVAGAMGKARKAGKPSILSFFGEPEAAAALPVIEDVPSDDPYWSDQTARQNPATWLAEQYVERQRQAANAQPDRPNDINVAMANQIKKAAAARQNPVVNSPWAIVENTGIPSILGSGLLGLDKAATAANAGPKMGENPTAVANTASAPTPTAAPKISAADIAKGVAEQQAALKKAGSGTKKAAGSKTSDGLPTGGVFTDTPEEGIAAAAAKPKSRADAVKEYLDMLKGDGKASAEMKAQLDKLDKDRGMDSMSSGILGAIATIAQGGPNMLGRGLAGGIGGYQAAEAQQQALAHKVAAERLKMLASDVTEEGQNKRAATGLAAADVQAEKAALVAAAQQARTDAMERMKDKGIAGMIVAAQARAGGGENAADKNLLALHAQGTAAAKEVADRIAKLPTYEQRKYTPQQIQELQNAAYNQVFTEGAGLLQVNPKPYLRGANTPTAQGAGAPLINGKPFDPRAITFN